MTSQSRGNTRFVLQWVQAARRKNKPPAVVQQLDAAAQDRELQGVQAERVPHVPRPNHAPLLAPGAVARAGHVAEHLVVLLLPARPPPHAGEAPHEDSQPLPIDLRRDDEALGTDGVEQLQGLHARGRAQISNNISGSRGEDRWWDARHQFLPHDRAHFLRRDEQLAGRVDDEAAGDGRRA